MKLTLVHFCVLMSAIYLQGLMNDNFKRGIDYFWLAIAFAVGFYEMSK